jgi:hypothetical protein
MIVRLCVACALGAAVLAAPAVSLAAPQIAEAAPLALAPGRTVELTIQGRELQDVRRLWASFAARCELVPAEDDAAKKGEKLVCRVTVPRGEQLGVGAIRVVTGAGVSNPWLVMLDDLPTAAESSDNHAPDNAQAVERPMAIDGRCEPLLEDYYRFHAAAGEQVSFEVVAQRLGGVLDPVLRLLTAAGEELVRVDDSDGAGGDSRFVHTFQAEGDYLLAISDVRHAGGAAYRYRLRVGAFPLITAVYPAGGPAGAVMSFELSGRDAGASSLVNVALPELAGRQQLVSFSVPGPPAGGSGWFRVEASTSNETLEQEPNDAPPQASSATLPGALIGRLDKPGDCDYYRFAARKGQRLHAVALTRELGSACDLYVSLHKADGGSIAAARQERQSILDAEIPEDGDYLLRVEDLAVGAATGHVYRVVVDGDFPGFTLSAEQPQYSVPQGGTFVVKVLAQRMGYGGPIELSVDGPEGAQLEGSVFDGAETLLKVTLPATIAAGELRMMRIVGKPKAEGATGTATANQRGPLVGMFPNVLSLPTELESSIAVGVGPPFPPFFSLSLPAPEAYFPRRVGQSTFDVAVNRTSDAFKDPVALAVEGVPDGVTAEVAPVDDGAKAYRITLKGPPDMPEGEFRLRIVGTGKFQEQTHTTSLDDVLVRVTEPLVASVAMTGPIVQGGQQQAEVQLVRFGDNPQPVRLQVSDGPPGLSSPIFVKIPADASKTALRLTADADAPVGRFENLVVVASTVVDDENVTVSSKPAAIEIQPAPTEQATEATP